MNDLFGHHSIIPTPSHYLTGPNASAASGQKSGVESAYQRPHGLRDPHPHQALALEMLKASLRSGKRRPLIMMPTGSGKTVLAARIVIGAMAKGKRVGFLVPMINLIDQTFARFVENGIDPGDMGVIQADHEWRRPSAPVQICSIQTLARRGMPEVDMLLVDEAHLRDVKLHDWLASDEAKGVLAIGLSATPFAKGLGRVYDDLICPVTMADLIESGHLSQFRVFAPSHPDLNGVKIDAKSGDYQTGELSERMSKGRLVADIVENWLEHGENRPTLCFAVDRAHAAVLHEQFEKSGVTSAYVDANTPREDRLVLAGKFSRGEIRVICNIGTMTTGVDLDVRCIIFARPTKSASLLMQCIGRGLRTAEGKDRVIIFDHSDTHLRLGMVTDISIDKLDTRKPGAGDSTRKENLDALPHECSKCQCLVPAATLECPNCGHVAKRRSNVVTEAGELVEFGVKGKPKKDSAHARLIAQGKQAVFCQIKHIAKARNWSDGRRSHAYRDIFGVWPRGFDHCDPMEPTNELLGWLRHKAIAFAASKAAARLVEIESNEL